MLTATDTTLTPSTTAQAGLTTLTTIMTIDSDSETFGIGTLTVVVTLPTSSSFSTMTGGGITTDTSVPPSRPAMTSSVTSTSSSTSSVITSAPYQKASGPSAGQLAGIIVGSVVGGCLLMAAIFLFCCWRRKRRRSKDDTKNVTVQISGSGVPQTSNRGNAMTRQDQQPSNGNTTADRRRSYWRRSNNPDDIGVAVDPSGRQGFVRMVTPSRPRSRSYLPISAPIPIERASIRESFSERFFKPPQPNPQSNPQVNPQSASQAADDFERHGSDATTIRTSGNPPTPNRPPITLLRLCSTSTAKSKSASFEGEEKLYENDEVPPLPTFATFQPSVALVAPINLKLDTQSLAQRDLEAGIKTNLSKATSRIPLTPVDNDGSTDLWLKSTASPIPRSSLSGSRRNQTLTQNYTRGNAASNTRSVFAKGSKTQFPVLSSPPSPLPIPDRQSSKPRAQVPSDEERLLSGGEKSTPEIGWAQKDPVQHPSVGMSSKSPLKKVTYPRIPMSTSETRFSGPMPSPCSVAPPPQDFRPAQFENTRTLLRKPLSTISSKDDPQEGPSNCDRDEERLQPPKRISVPKGGPVVSQSRLSSNPANSRATLTPSRTLTGDLFLTVDMVDVLDYVIFD